jgi:type I restriction-modification system DNA methylase subunit
VEKLSEYDVESLTLNPRWARDVFKLLYEELVPRREVRQRLGIYTTPDWLAELILDNIGLTVDNMIKMRSEGKDPLDVRVLDPGVGTGTFLTLYIQRIGEYLRKIYGGSIPPKDAEEALRKVVRNVVGFDVDVLALMTARANYLIALASAGLLQYKRQRRY